MQIETENTPVTLSDLQNILYKMDAYKRTSGYMAMDLSNKLTFFDGKPSFGGVFITRVDVLKFIDDF